MYYHGIQYDTWEAYEAARRKREVLFKKQGFYGQVTVTKGGDIISLKTNGKTDASNHIEDLASFFLSANLPIGLHPDPGEVAIIGLGGGFTLRAAVHHKGLKRITMVEIDPLVVEATRKYFAEFNDHALDDPRVELVINDGRNFIEKSSRKYDVITSQPPNIWVSGVSGLFTEEFYQSVRRHLKPGGIFCQWAPYYELEEEQIEIVLDTLRSVFSSVAMWTNGVDVLAVATDEAPSVDREKIRERLKIQGIIDDLELIESTPSLLLMELESLAEDLLREEGDGGERKTVNRDDRPILEFSSARNLFYFRSGER
jgi:spermidine synthase